MIKAVVKTDLQEIPETCCKCKCKRRVVGGHGNEYYYHCGFNGDYVEPFWKEKNPNCPLVKEEPDNLMLVRTANVGNIYNVKSVVLYEDYRTAAVFCCLLGHNAEGELVKYVLPAKDIVFICNEEYEGMMDDYLKGAEHERETEGEEVQK